MPRSKSAHDLVLVGIIATLFLSSCTCSKKDEPVSGANPSSERVAAATQGGPLKGKVTAKGKGTSGEILRMNADAYCAKFWQGKKAEIKKVEVGPSDGLKGAVVYFKNAPKAGPVPTTPVTLDQKGCVYEPTVLALQAGQPLLIKNSDSTLHNVHALPKSNSEFNFGMATAGGTSEKKFAKPEVGIRFKCDVHGWMTASISVFDHPYFAITDADGNFELTSVPDGVYTLEAFHPALGTKEAAPGNPNVAF